MLFRSKVFAKRFMERHGILTARSAQCRSMKEVEEALRGFSVPVVVKADGLAAGKGVVIAETHREAERAAAEMFNGDLLGQAEQEVVLEEFLPGEELSFFALCDGKTAVPIAAAQDHKRVGEGIRGRIRVGWGRTRRTSCCRSRSGVSCWRWRSGWWMGWRRRGRRSRGCSSAG